jgi:protease-4
MLVDFKEETGVPLYVSMMGVCASGGYYIAMAGDEVYALPTTWTGSIGVRLGDIFQMERLGEKLGVGVVTITSGPNKAIGSPFTAMTDEQRGILQTMVDSSYEDFLEIILAGRPGLAEDTLRPLADGRILTAGQAEDAGLIDDVMYLDEVIEKARKDTGSSRARVVLYRRTGAEDVDSPYARFAPAGPTAGPQGQAGLVNVDVRGLLPAGGARPYYVWTGH